MKTYSIMLDNKQYTMYHKFEYLLEDMIDFAKNKDIMNDIDNHNYFFKVEEPDYLFQFNLYKDNDVIYSWNFAMRKVAHMYFEEPKFVHFFESNDNGMLFEWLNDVLQNNGRNILND